MVQMPLAAFCSLSLLAIRGRLALADSGIKSAFDVYNTLALPFPPLLP